jgi:folate-binding protein YgfZ
VKFSLFRYEAAQVSIPLLALTAKGADAVSFIQGQSTQKLTHFWQFHAFIERTGKVECYFLARQNEQQVEILVSHYLINKVQDRFEKYVISEDVSIFETDKKDVWIALGPNFTSPRGEASLAGEAAFISNDKWPNLTEASKEDWNEWSYWQGIPSLDSPEAIGELITQTTIFQAAVDLRKGCFPGQEVVAKITNIRGAAWAPTLLVQESGEFPKTWEISLEDKVVAKIIPHENKLEKYFRAMVLRDVRVDGFKIISNEGQTFRTQNFPRYKRGAKEKAQELYHIGTDAFLNGNEALAQQAWAQAIVVDSNFADAYESMGVMLGRQKKYTEAESWMRKLLVVDPQSVMAHTNLSLFLMQQDRIQEAEDHKAKATVASFASFGRKAAEERAEKEEAQKLEIERLKRERMFRQVLEIDPEDALANYGLGGLCLERAQYAEAVKYLEQVIQTDPQYAVAYLALGKAYKALDQKEKANSIWEQGIKIAAKKGELMPANEMQSLLHASN